MKVLCLLTLLLLLPLFSLPALAGPNAGGL